MRAPAPDHAPPAEGPTVTMQRRHADQGRDLLPRERPQLGEFQQQRVGTHGPNALGTLQQVVIFPPQRAGPESGLEVVVQRGDGRIEPRNMGSNILREARVRPRQAVLLRGPHADQWLAAPQKGAQLLRLGVGQRARRRADHVGKVRQGPGIPRVRFGQLARGPGKNRGPDAGSRRPGEGPPWPRRWSPHAPSRRWLPAQSGWGGGPAPGPRGSSPRWHRWGRPTAPRRGAGQCPTGLWPHQYRQNMACHSYELLFARPCTYGLNGTKQLSGLGESRT